MKQGASVWVVVELTDDGEFLGCLDAYYSEGEARIAAHNLNYDLYPGASRCYVSKAYLKGKREENSEIQL